MRIKSLVDFMQAIIDLEDKPGHLKLFRGVSDHKYKLLPKIARKSKVLNDQHSLINAEEFMIERAMTNNPDLFSEMRLPIQKIIMLQHYGLDTRLLDFTSNALVALYFACQKNSRLADEERDGKVYIIQKSKLDIKTSFDPFINAIADMSYASRNIITADIHMEEFALYLSYLETRDYWKFPNYANAE